jgi:aspartate/methionine/tyrosine aminotransferase
MKISAITTQATENDKFNFAKRMQEANISIIKEMMILAELERKKGREVVSLGVGIPHYKMPKYIREKVSEALNIKPDIDKYTYFAGLPKLRQLIAQQAQTELGIPTNEDNILISPGSMAGLQYTMTALVNPGDEIIIPSPYFPSYAQQIYLAGGQVVESPLKIVNGRYTLNVSDIANKINNNTKAIILNTPNNPSGAIYFQEDIEAVVDLALKHGILIITDEVYDYLTFDNVTSFKVASIKRIWPHIIRCCSFSKKYGMTGWRAGFVQADKSIIDTLLKIHDNTIVCTPHISQEAAFAAISEESEENLLNAQSLAFNRDLICSRLDRLPNLFSYIKPLGTYYIFPRYSLAVDSISFAKRMLFEAGVVVIPGIGFGSEGEGHVRMSFGATKDEINSAFDKIDAWSKTII